ncbi:MAG TPA: hypothetical protein VEQ63_04550 [Bryobacteraceae bacterium]|nr:hypothetical protein [Bryobacteraceae bacterium]
MARGWESKSVESQMEALEERRAVKEAAALSLQQETLQDERRHLEVSRDRLRRELDLASHPRRREQLELAIGFLQEKLAKLS